MNGLDTANIVASLKPVDDALMALVDSNPIFVSEPGSADVDWTAIAGSAKPAADNPYAGGRTFRFDDELQAVAPIYFRIRYGQGSTNTPGVFIQVGTAMNADGTLAGNMCTQKILGLGVVDNNPFPVWISGGPNFITFAIQGRTAATAAAVIIIERMRDEEGNETDEGAILLTHGASGYKGRVQPIPSSPYIPVPLEALAEIHITPIGGMSGIGAGASDLIMAPIAVPNDGEWRYIKALAYRWTDIAAGTVFDQEHLGDSVPYITLGDKAGNQWALPNSTIGIAARWE